MPVSDPFVPEFFGPGNGLYGCFHPAAGSGAADAVTICQPTGHEYERCHRAMRQLSILLARRGFSALRFDYRSSGDSAGDCEALDLEDMRADIHEAMAYCRRKTGAVRQALIGLRLGATLAAGLAARSDQVDTLVLYAPAFDGGALLGEWREEQHRYLSKYSHPSRPPGADEVLGFHVGKAFRDQLDRVFRPEIAASALQRVLFVTSHEQAQEPLLQAWQSAFAERDIDVTVECVDDIAIWRREPMDAMVPARTLRAIVDWVAGRGDG